MAEWIEIDKLHLQEVLYPSPLAMAEWIEIPDISKHLDYLKVSASDGGVD